MVNVINTAFTVTDIDQHMQHSKNIFIAQYAGAGNLRAANATIELHTTNVR